MDLLDAIPKYPPIIIIGNESSGKTSLINALLGFTLGLTKLTTATTNVTIIKCLPNESMITPKLSILSLPGDSKLTENEVNFPFVKSLKRLTNGLEKFGVSPIELTVEWNKFKQKRVYIDCPGLLPDNDENSQDNDKIKTSIEQAYKLYSTDNGITLFCFSNESYSTTFKLVEYLGLKLEISKSQFVPIFTKIDLFEKNPKNLSTVLKQPHVQWLNDKDIHFVGVPILVSDNETLDSDIEFYKNTVQVDKDVGTVETFYKTYKSRKYPNMRSFDKMFFGFTKLLEKIQMLIDVQLQKGKKELEGLLKQANDKVKEIETKMENNVWEQEARDKCQNEWLLMYDTFAMFTASEVWGNITSFDLNEKYGVTLEEELNSVQLMLNDSFGSNHPWNKFITEFRKLSLDTNSSKCIGYYQLSRDASWIENSISSFDFTSLMQSIPSVNFNIEPSFKKIKMTPNSKIPSLFLNTKDFSEQSRREKISKYFIRLSKCISKLHFEKIKRIMITTMNAVMNYCQVCPNNIQIYFEQVVEECCNKNMAGFTTMVKGLVDIYNETNMQHALGNLYQQGFIILREVTSIENKLKVLNLSCSHILLDLNDIKGNAKKLHANWLRQVQCIEDLLEQDKKDDEYNF